VQAKEEEEKDAEPTPNAAGTGRPPLLTLPRLIFNDSNNTVTIVSGFLAASRSNGGGNGNSKPTVGAVGGSAATDTAGPSRCRSHCARLRGLESECCAPCDFYDDGPCLRHPLWVEPISPAANDSNTGKDHSASRHPARL